MKKSNFIVGLILCIWFVISFVTNILGPIMPAIIDTYKISLTLAAFLPFSFFLAYGIMSIPSGILIEKYGAKISMILAFGLNLSGVLAFALFPNYLMALISLFTIGIGMAMLQVIINPLMRVSGGEENFAFYSVFGQGVFGFASFLSPFFFVFLMNKMKEGNSPNIILKILKNLVPPQLPWTALYWIFSLIFLIIIIIIGLIKFPKVELKEEEKAGAFHSYLELFGKPQVWLYFLGIMAYVGLEQGISNWISKFLSTYHGLNPDREGASTIAWFWGSMTIGCLMGLIILKLVDSKKVLRISTLLTFICLGLALYGPKMVSALAFSSCGFFISMIFSIIFSLALNSENAYHGSFSGILCSGIFGGALVPLIIGFLGDHFGLRIAMLFLLIPLTYILTISFWAKPLIDNKIISLKELFAETNDQKSIS